MKLPCEIVQDLLPLYEDGLCSPASREAVEAHLKECPGCRGQNARMQEFTIPESPPDPGDKALVRSFRKIRRRWALSLVAILLILPMALMTVNQVRGTGLCFSNIDEAFLLWRYAQALENEDFDKAADCMDYERLYRELLEVAAMSPEDHQKQFIPVTIGDRKWMATEDFYERYLRYEGDPDQFWSGMIYNHTGVMIPEDVWNSVLGDSMLPDEMWIAEEYVPLDTPWGTYMVEAYSSVLKYESAQDLCACLDFVPAEIYEEALPAMAEEAQQQYNYIQENYGSVADMTLEEFIGYVHNNYVEELKICAEKGYSLDSRGFSDAYFIRDSNAWVIVWEMEAAYGGKNYTFTMDATVRDGGITTGAFSTRSDSSVLDAVYSALILSYRE